MTHTTDDPLLTQLVQLALVEQALYHGNVDGVWGPNTEEAFEVYSNYNRYAEIGNLEMNLLPEQKSDLMAFVKNWNAPESRGRYQGVAALADIPAELVAALHWRESGGDFTTYLHNGDPLKDDAGNSIPTTDEPKGVLFPNWTAAAVDAIKREVSARAASGIDSDCRLLSAMCVFAEYFNGEGYRHLGVPDPYVLAGTTGYEKGKYCADGKYDANEVDHQLGVLVMLREIVV